LALLAAAAAAQAQILPADGADKLRNDFNKKENQQLLQQLVKNGVAVTPQHQEAVDFWAKWYAYRLTWPEVQNKPGEVHRLLEDYQSNLDSILRYRAVNQPFLTQFAKQMAGHVDEVLKNDKPIARVNAVRLLVRQAAEGHEEVGDVLVKAVKDPNQNDGVKYWAFKALQELFGYGLRQGPPATLKDKDLEARCVQALIEFIEQKPPHLPSTPPEEIEGYKSLRREAVHALGLTRAPATVDPKTKALQGRTALTLLRVLMKDGLTPEPRLDERAEAAVGLGYLQGKLFETYQPDYAAYFVGWFLVDFAAEYNAEVEGGKRSYAWKHLAARLAGSLTGPLGMSPDVAAWKKKQDKPIVDYVAGVAAKSAALLTAIENGAVAAPAPFADWLTNNPPPSGTVYKGVADAVVKVQQR
jgi:HEAT repeat protein